jgi:hypothetical protein
MTRTSTKSKSFRFTASEYGSPFISHPCLSGLYIELEDRVHKYYPLHRDSQITLDERTGEVVILHPVSFATNSAMRAEFDEEKIRRCCEKRAKPRLSFDRIRLFIEYRLDHENLSDERDRAPRRTITVSLTSYHYREMVKLLEKYQRRYPKGSLVGARRPARADRQRGNIHPGP